MNINQTKPSRSGSPAESEEDMIENIKGYKLIKFNIGYDVYLLKGKGICKEFESKDKALEYLEFFISIN